RAAEGNRSDESLESGVEEVTMQTDPVCNMKVEEKKAAARSSYQGKDYYFCSAGCKTKFDQNPGQYASRP
ncbi:MAG TPA: YHS domain-containing protein, partial [Thermoanaerobaculia bacterium]|nr:YHS domain-containing protein [Thermoanaerobaculia bacterium]